jgi:hypothetical protein
MNDRERRWTQGRVVAALALVAVGGYLAIARWKALHPGPSVPRLTGPTFNLTWWR